jgi:hypothetical protein
MPASVRRLSLVLLFLGALPAFADEPRNVTALATVPTRAYAVSYADAWAKSRNSNYPSFSSDCTNFASQTIGPNGAGYPMTASWYAKRNFYFFWDWTNSWSVVTDFLTYAQKQGMITFITFENPTGQWSSGTPGDIISYQWSGTGPWNHLSILVSSNGIDPTTGLRAALVDQHTTDRYHAVFTLQPYNPDWRTTRIGRWRVNYSR